MSCSDSSGGSFGVARRTVGFTMVEMLVVIAVIVTLAGILMTALGRGREAVKFTQAENTIRILANAMETFKTQFGYYPVKNSGDNDQFRYEPSSSSGILNALARSGFKPDSQTLKIVDPDDSVRVMKDPWDNAYCMQYSDNDGSDSRAPWKGGATSWDDLIGDNVEYVIYSMGPKGPTPAENIEYAIFNCKPTRVSAQSKIWRNPPK